MTHAIIFSSRTNKWERSSGAHRIATYLRQHGMDVEVVDFTPYWRLDYLKEFVRSRVTKDTVFFGFSIFFNYWDENMTAFTTWLKLEYPHIKTVAGGQMVLQAELTNIDIWVDSYGEEAILAVARSLAGNTLTGIKFAAEYFGDKKVIKALTTYPAYNLGDYSIIMEKRDFLESWEWVTVEFSRGCKFSCAFCNFPILGVKEDTSRSKESFEYEMKYNFDNFGIDRYYVADETFNDRVEKIRKFADVTESLNFDPFFSGFIRADLLSVPGQIEELHRMNFGGQYYGIETFHRPSGKVVGKGADPEKVKKLLLDTRTYFRKNNSLYRGTISLIIGLPFETKETIQQAYKWLRKNWHTEGLIVFPLVVEDTDISPESNYTNLSSFGKNLQKYGLRVMDLESAEKQSSIDDKMRWEWRYGNYAKNEVLWEHDTMNIIQAWEYARPLQDLAITRLKMNSWAMGNPEVYLQRKLSIDQLTKRLLQSDKIPNSAINIQPFIDAYSLKKINYKKEK